MVEPECVTIDKARDMVTAAIAQVFHHLIQAFLDRLAFLACRRLTTNPTSFVRTRITKGSWESQLTRRGIPPGWSHFYGQIRAFNNP